MSYVISVDVLSFIYILIMVFLFCVCVYFDDRLYCLNRGINYKKTNIVEYGYATVYFTEPEEDQE